MRHGRERSQFWVHQGITLWRQELRLPRGLGRCFRPGLGVIPQRVLRLGRPSPRPSCTSTGSAGACHQGTGDLRHRPGRDLGAEGMWASWLMAGWPQLSIYSPPTPGLLLALHTPASLLQQFPNPPPLSAPARFHPGLPRTQEADPWCGGAGMGCWGGEGGMTGDTSSQGAT